MTTELQALAARFVRFGQGRAASTPLYSHLALGIAKDTEILELASQAASTPVTNLFLSAVQYLLRDGVHPLCSYYPIYCDSPLPAAEAYPHFLSFCLDHRDDVIRIIQTRRTQTNEVRRCGYVATGFALAARRSGLALSIIDVGSSAGLHLLWREFSYNYGGRRVGCESSKVEIAPRLEGDCSPWLPTLWPETARQTGIDLLPLRVANPDDCAWLRALIWPEHPERLRLLNRALSIAQANPPLVVAGDALDLLPAIALSAPSDSLVCICHNYALNQFAEADRARFDGMLEQLSREREICRLSAEWIGTETPEFVMRWYDGGLRQERLLAEVDDHGAWIRWKDRESPARFCGGDE